MITDAQRKARECFDIDVAMAALPPDGPGFTHRGAAGVRLRACFVADISDALLREMARETLGAVRCSEQYLDALRIILGNQAEAEKHGYVLEMNQRVSFASANVMRTIIDQMQAAGVSFGKPVSFGSGRRQVVQCFGPADRSDEVPRRCRDADGPPELERMNREQEARDDARRESAESRGEFQRSTPDPYPFITEADVPY